MGARFDRIVALGSEKLDRFYGDVKRQRVCAYEGCERTFIASGQGSTRRFCDEHQDQRTRDKDRERHRMAARPPEDVDPDVQPTVEE